VLAEAGIRVFRSKDKGLNEWAERISPKTRQMSNLIDKLLPIPPTVVLPKWHPTGLLELPSSLLLMGRNGVRRLSHPEVWRLKTSMGIEAARRKTRIFHLWFHPSNFYYDTDKQFGILETTLKQAARARDAGSLDVKTMADFSVLAKNNQT